MEPAPWLMALPPRFGWDPADLDEASAFLDFLESLSRGSSWQRCPILRLMHLVHGLSCSPHGSRQRLTSRLSTKRAVGDGGTQHTRSQVMCWTERA